MDFLAPLPNWTIAAIAGGLGGGIGALIANGPLAKSRKWLPILLAVVAVQFSSKVIVPSLEIERSLLPGDIKFPQKIDEITNLTSFSKEGKVLTYTYEVSADLASADPNWLIEKNASAICANFQIAFKAGNLTSANYVYRHQSGESAFSIDKALCEKVASR